MYAVAPTPEILEFMRQEWVVCAIENYRHIIKEGNPMYEYDNRKLLLKMGCSEGAINAVRDECLSYLDPDEKDIRLEAYRTYVPRERPLGKKSKDSKKKIAEFESREDEKPVVPVFGQINPLPKKRKKK